MTSTFALVRSLPHSFAELALRKSHTSPISQSRAYQAHEAYVRCLTRVLGPNRVFKLNDRHDLADSVFVEDTVIVLPNQHAIGLTLPALSRRDEQPDMLHTLSSKFDFTVLESHEPDEYLDGGDVLFCHDNSYLVGLGTRTNAKGFERFKSLVQAQDETSRVNSIAVPDCALHLKSVCTMFGPRGIAMAKQAYDTPGFLEEFKEKVNRRNAFDIFSVPDMDAANVVFLRSAQDADRISVLVRSRKEFPASFPVLLEAAKRLGISELVELDYSELAKADAALTCCSVLFEMPDDFASEMDQVLGAVSSRNGGSELDLDDSFGDSVSSLAETVTEVITTVVSSPFE